MAIKYKHSDLYNTYFITFTCNNWLPLYEITNGYDTVYKWFDYLKEKDIAKIIGFVIMPNHVHVILYFTQHQFKVNSIISNAKRFMAYEIVNRLEYKKNEAILLQLKNSLTVSEIEKGQLHKVFKNSFDAKAIFSDKFLFQKLDYMHKNPVSGKWKLVEDYVSYKHSSASFYELQIVKEYEPSHFKDV